MIILSNIVDSGLDYWSYWKYNKDCFSNTEYYII